jgi:hypothetical protein
LKTKVRRNIFCNANDYFFDKAESVIRTRLLMFLLSCGLIVKATAPVTAYAQTAVGPERQKIEALLKRVGDLKDVKFVRNGSIYDASLAVRFLRGKWDANDRAVNTARDFIEIVASYSGSSRNPYWIRFNDGREMTSRDFLLAELKAIEPTP